VTCQACLSGIAEPNGLCDSCDRRERLCACGWADGAEHDPAEHRPRMTTTLTIHPPCALINANDRSHHHAKAKLTKAWREAGRLAAIDAPAHMFTRAHVECWIRFPTNHRRDVGNYYGTAKACLDGITETRRFLADDSDDYIVGPDMRRDRPNGPLRVTVTIEEI
jgi:crossover junction endodeoxyribonuclease RusA